MLEGLSAGRFDNNHRGGAILFHVADAQEGLCWLRQRHRRSMARRGDKAPPPFAIRETSP